jgi:hypothetical protein
MRRVGVSTCLFLTYAAGSGAFFLRIVMKFASEDWAYPCVMLWLESPFMTQLFFLQIITNGFVLKVGSPITYMLIWSTIYPPFQSGMILSKKVVDIY